jgi:hypothetical protein
MPLRFRTLHRAAILVVIQFGTGGLVCADAPPATQGSTAPIARTTGHARQLPSLPRNRPPRIGDKGTLVNGRATIVQIIDQSNAVANVEWYTERKELIGDPRRGIVVDRIDDHHGMVWLHMPTQGLVNGRTFTSNQIFEVTKTTSYQTARGAWTVMYLQMAEQPPATGGPK